MFTVIAWVLCSVISLVIFIKDVVIPNKELHPMDLVILIVIAIAGPISMALILLGLSDDIVLLKWK